MTKGVYLFVLRLHHRSRPPTRQLSCGRTQLTCRWTQLSRRSHSTRVGGDSSRVGGHSSRTGGHSSRVGGHVRGELAKEIIPFQPTRTTWRWCTCTWPAVASHFGLSDLTAWSWLVPYLQLHLRVCLRRYCLTNLRDLASADWRLLQNLRNHEP